MVSPYKSSLMTGVMQHALLDYMVASQRLKRSNNIKDVGNNLTPGRTGSARINQSNTVPRGTWRLDMWQVTSASDPYLQVQLGSAGAGWDLSQEQEALSGRWQQGLWSQGPHKGIRISWVEQRVPGQGIKTILRFETGKCESQEKGSWPRPAGPSSITVVTASSPWTGERSVQ
jgi:hypothetical protein